LNLSDALHTQKVVYLGMKAEFTGKQADEKRKTCVCQYVVKETPRGKKQV